MITPRRAMVFGNQLHVVAYSRPDDAEIFFVEALPLKPCGSTVLPENCACRACEMHTIARRCELSDGVWSASWPVSKQVRGIRHEGP